MGRRGNFFSRIGVGSFGCWCSLILGIEEFLNGGGSLEQGKSEFL